MTGDRDRGINALRIWYRVSGHTQHTFDEVIAYYDQAHPTFLDRFGGAVRLGDFTQDQLESSFKYLTYDDQSQLPTTNSFFEVLAGQAEAFTYEKFQEIVSQTVSDTTSAVEKVAVVGIAGYALWIVGGFVALMVLQRMGHGK